MSSYQTTLRSSVRLTGIGVHSGKPVTISINPADADTGIIFHVHGPRGAQQDIRALVSEVGSTDLSTVLGDPAGTHVATVEHLMASLLGLGVDNVAIDIEGSEIPIFDGSAASYVEAFDHAGLVALGARRRFIRVLKPVRVEAGQSWAEFVPHAGTRLEVDIDFDSPAIGRQSLAFELSAASFRKDVARARTFGFIKDVERLWANGFALGSSLENSVVIGDDHRVINIEGLRYPDEFVRHKMLDAVGDLALAGARFVGCFRSYRGGHKLNAAALRRLLSDTSAFEIAEVSRRERGRLGEAAVGVPAHAPRML